MTTLGTEVGWRKTHAVTDGQATLPPAPTGVAAGTTPPPPLRSRAEAATAGPPPLRRTALRRPSLPPLPHPAQEAAASTESPLSCYRLVSPPQTHAYRLQLCLHRRVRGPAPRADR